MYSLVVLLSFLATALFLRAYTVDERPARRWPVLFGLALAIALYTHNWALFLGASMFVVWLALLVLAPAAERRARLRDGALGFGSTALLYLPWVPTLLFQAAHTGAPWSRKPDYEQITMEATHRLLGHTAWLVLVVGRGRRRGRARPGRPRAGADRAGPRRARRRRDRGRHRAARLDAPRSSRPRGRCATSRSPPAVPAARRRPGSPTRAGSGIARPDASS